MRVVALLLSLVAVVSVGACSKKPCPSGSISVGNQCKKIPDAGGGADGSFDGDAGGASNDESGADETKLEDGGSPSPIEDDGGTGPVTCVPPACDPCELEPSLCLNGGVCSTTATGFECACTAGFSGPTCKVDVCLTDPCDHGTCIRSRLGRTCECEDDWQGDACDRNANAQLKGLSTSVGRLHPSFRPDIFAYVVAVGVSAPEASVTAEPEQPDGVSIEVNGVGVAPGEPSEPIALALGGEQTASIVVTADDGKTTKYSVTYRRSLVQQAYLKSPMAAANDALTGMISGQPVCGLLYDGTQLLAAAEARPRIEIFSATVGGASFVKTFTPSASTPLGTALASDADWVITSSAAGAYAFTRDQLGRTTPKGQPLQVSGSANINGSALSISEGWVVVAEPQSDRVYLFELENAEWKYRGLLPTPEISDAAKFGFSIDIEGSVLAVGAPEFSPTFTGGGAAYIYERSGDQWTLVSTLKKPAQPLFGASTNVSEGRVAIATLHTNIFGDFIGKAAVDVYEKQDDGEWERSGGASVPSAPDVSERVSPLHFGWSMDFDGGTIVVGSPAESAGGVGVNAPRDPNEAAIGASGAAYVFTETSKGWELAAYLKASNPGEGDSFGTCVVIHGNTVVVSSPGEDSAATTINGDQADNSAEDSGAVYVFGIDCANVPEGADVDGC